MSDDSMNLAHYIERERDMLTQRRADVNAAIEQWTAELASIDRSFTAINAYEAAKNGRPLRSPRAASTGRRSRRGGRRDAILEAVRSAPTGMTRGELIEHFGLKGDKRGEMSVSNALTVLIKDRQLMRQDGKYHVSAAATQLREAAE